jgi:hypothetical protein
MARRSVEYEIADLPDREAYSSHDFDLDDEDDISGSEGGSLIDTADALTEELIKSAQLHQLEESQTESKQRFEKIIEHKAGLYLLI